MGISTFGECGFWDDLAKMAQNSHTNNIMKLNDISHQAHLLALESHPIFALLPNTQQGIDIKKSLLSMVSIHEYTKGEIVFLQHSPVVNLYFLLDGRVDCHRQLPSGQESLIAQYDSIGLINESVLWDWQKTDREDLSALQNKETIAAKHSALLSTKGGIHQLTATSRSTSLVASLCVESYFKTLDEFELGGLLKWFCECISKRLHHHIVSSDLLAFVQAKSKLSYYFITHYPIDKPFKLLCTQKQLAGQIGLRPETLSRTLKEMMAANLINKEGATYQIIDIEGLLALVSE